MPQWIGFLDPPRPTFAEDATEDELAIVARHFAYLEGLLKDGTLILAGRTIDDEGLIGIVVFRASDRATAQRIAAADPAVETGLFTATLRAYSVALIERP